MHRESDALRGRRVSWLTHGTNAVIVRIADVNGAVRAQADTVRPVKLRLIGGTGITAIPAISVAGQRCHSIKPGIDPTNYLVFRIDYQHAVLIVDSSTDFIKTPLNWAVWFTTVGHKPPTHLGPRFSQADHAVDAALAGVGVVLGRRALVIKDIAEGRLIAPFPIALNTGARFRFLCPKGSEDRPHIKAFREWILAEIAKTQHIADSMTRLDPVQP